MGIKKIRNFKLISKWKIQLTFVPVASSCQKLDPKTPRFSRTQFPDFFPDPKTHFRAERRENKEKQLFLL
jgi:hypothetical protein